jgi:hypothetical protein
MITTPTKTRQQQSIRMATSYNNEITDNRRVLINNIQINTENSSNSNCSNGKQMVFVGQMRNLSFFLWYNWRNNKIIDFSIFLATFETPVLQSSTDSSNSSQKDAMCRHNYCCYSII